MVKKTVPKDIIDAITSEAERTDELPESQLEKPETSKIQTQEKEASELVHISSHAYQAFKHSVVANSFSTPATGADVPKPTVGANESERISQIQVANLNYRNS